MNCGEVRERFSEFMDGMLPEELGQEFKAHLERCKECRRELQLFEKTVKILRKLPRMQAPADFMPSLLEKLEDQSRPWWKKAFYSFNQALELMPLRAMSAAAAVIFAVVLALTWGRDKLQEAGPLPFMSPEPSAVSSGPSNILPVEFASTNPSDSLTPDFPETPSDFILSVIESDSTFRGYPVYPHPRGTGALIHMPEFVIEVEMDPAEFPIIQAFGKGRMPRSLKEAEKMYPIYIRTLPSPVAPPLIPDK